jgi:hypothetical protein
MSKGIMQTNIFLMCVVKLIKNPKPSCEVSQCSSFTCEGARAEKINDLPFLPARIITSSHTASISSEISRDDFNFKLNLGSYKATEVKFPVL